MTKVLALETSCDETAAAILEYARGEIRVLANIVSSQAHLHAQWGGVVPQLASREHIRNIPLILEETLKQADLTAKDLDLLAVTQGPGLMPALLIGVNAAKALSLLWHKPLLGIQHLEGHIYANLLGSHNDKFQMTNFKLNPEDKNSELEKRNSELRFPLLALVVSGGHTQLVLMRDHFQYEILGETQDDAAGEAFDKVARLLGLPYPGGPEIAKRADEFRIKNSELDIKNLTDKFPRPMLTADNFDFSFSGLKTAVLYALQKVTPENKASPDFVPGMCHAFQEAVVDVLVAKAAKALRHYAPATFVIAAGVSANVRLRERLAALLREQFPATAFLTLPFAYSLDNAAMIGVAALLRYERLSGQEREQLRMNALQLEPDANLPLA